MYQRQVKLYKGVDNVIQFIFKNQDQKPVNVTGWTITFNMQSDPEGSLVVSKNSNQKITGSVTSGVFLTGETVTQTTSGASAYFVNVGPDTGFMYIEGFISGTPDAIHTWVGQTTGAIYTPTAAPLNNGIIVVNAAGGIISASVTEFDLLNLTNDYYNYALTVTDPRTGLEQVVYTDENYESRGEILLRDGPYPTFAKSIEADIPTNNNFTTVTSGIVSDANSMQQSAHHTAQFYFTNFTGNITVQGTLDSLAWVTNGPPDLSWGNLIILASGNGTIISTSNTSSVINYTGQTSTDYCTFDGVYTAVRFLVAPTNANVNPPPVNRILYRA